MDSLNVVTLAPPLLLWAAVGYKAPALSRHRQPALSAYLAAITWLAVAMTLLVPPLAAALDALIGVPNLSWLAMYVAVLLSGFSAKVALLHETPDAVNSQRERHRRYACAALIAVLVVLFAVAHPAPGTSDFVSAYGGDPWVAVFLTTFYSGLAYVCLDMTPRCLRAARAVTGLLRLALRGSAAAGALSLLYLGYNGLVVGQLVTGHADDIVGDPWALSRVLLLVIVTFIAIGTSIPDWGPRLGVDALGESVSHYRDRLRVFRLWYDVRSVVHIEDVPSPAGRRRPLAPQRWSRWLGQRRAAALRDVLSIRDARFQLHRRVVDVADGRIALIRGGFHDFAQADELVAGLPVAERGRAAREAADLAIGIEAKRQGRPPCPRAVQEPDLIAGGLDTWSLDVDVEHLTQVARYYRRFRGASRRAMAVPTARPPASSQT